MGDAQHLGPTTDSVIRAQPPLSFMAKHGRRRRGGRVFPLRIKKTINLGTLASQDLVSDTLADTADDEIFLISADVTWSLIDLTAGEGPLQCGLSHSAYTSAQVEEWFESQGAWDRADLVLREHARRRCRQAGTFSGNDTEETLNEGKTIRTKLGWIAQEGETLRFWVFNDGEATLTTGADLKIAGTVWCRKV